MRPLLSEIDNKYFFSILLAFTFALPFNTLTSVNSLLMAALFLLWLYKLYSSQGTILYRTSLDIPLLGFFGWVSLSLLWTANFHESFTGFFALGKQVFLFYLVVTTVKTRDQFIKILLAFLAAMVIIDFYAIFDFIIRGGSFLDRDIRSGSFGSLDYNLLTILIVIFLPLGVIFGLHFISKKLKGLFYAFSLISLIALYFGYARAGWITIILQLILMSWFYSRRLFMIFLSSTIVLFFVFLVSFLAIKDHNAQEIKASQQSHLETLDPLTFELRIDVWKFGLTEALKHPFLGNGYGREIFQKVYQDKEIVKLTPHLHNTFLETLFELGIPGLILLLCCFWKIFSMSFSLIKKREDSFNQLYGIFMVTMLSGFLFKNLFDHMFIGNIAEIFWVLTGLLFSFSKKPHTSPSHIHLTFNVK